MTSRVHGLSLSGLGLFTGDDIFREFFSNHVSIGTGSPRRSDCKTEIHLQIAVGMTELRQFEP